MSAGDTPSTSAMLSKPSAESSGGSSAAASTSSASRSRIAFAYSARLSRWIAGRPALGCAKLAHHSFPERRIARGVSEIRTIEHDAAGSGLGLDVLVVADDAVTVD